MKTYLAALLLAIVFTSTIAQIPIGQGKQNIKVSKKIIRRELRRSLIQENILSKFEIYSLIKILKPIPILSYEVSEQALEYDSTKKIVDYLKPNDMFPFQSVMFLKKKKFHATLDCINIAYYTDCKPCNYNDSQEDKDHHHNYEEKKIFNAIKNRKYTLLFKVQYFRDAVWLIEKKEVKIYSPQDKLFYDPDEYIKKRCSVETIRNLALGKLNSFCD
ncbi:hypothetical protein GCM10010967_53250 [Dyadobacter beijingensis]|uniref:Uncharacterized protein n=1 Tax=Dyadobacter beijingensis TaxID=365489 RepID=A0ABQ2IHP5_9BACT|nr:hypothetical protein [Dyadobacter beijingensis]GGN10726.1 hypothetical protein GCM10010967_53250 [Dyadobacter beijingensis]